MRFCERAWSARLNSVSEAFGELSFVSVSAELTANPIVLLRVLPTDGRWISGPRFRIES